MNTNTNGPDSKRKGHGARQNNTLKRNQMMMLVKELLGREKELMQERPSLAIVAGQATRALGFTVTEWNLATVIHSSVVQDFRPLRTAGGKKPSPLKAELSGRLDTLESRVTRLETELGVHVRKSSQTQQEGTLS